MLPPCEPGRGLRRGGDRALLCERLLRCLRRVVVRLHLGGEAEHCARHPQPGGLEFGLPEGALLAELKQVDQGLRDPDLEGIRETSGEPDLAVEDWVADGARRDEIGASHPQLFERGEEIPVVGERDLDRALDGDLSFEERPQRLVGGRLDRLRRIPCDPLAALLLDRVLHVADAGVARHGGAACGGKRRYDPCSTQPWLPHPFLLSTSVIPHFGHFPEVFLVTPGCIGHT